MKICFITTGGSIDKTYSCYKSKLEVGESIINQFLEDGLVDFPYSIEEVCKKDSLDMNDTDRLKIVDCIKKVNTSHIIITHGTDTMTLTGRFLSQCFRDKVIVLTGAFKPAHFRSTDAIMNVGIAIGAVQSLKHGVYIAMNGHVLPIQEIVKDNLKMKFIKTSPGTKAVIRAPRRAGQRASLVEND
jgi:L-asparaginase